MKQHKVGNPKAQVKTCAGCGKKILPGRASNIGGRYYGKECARKELDKLNRAEGPYADGDELLGIVR